MAARPLDVALAETDVEADPEADAVEAQAGGLNADEVAGLAPGVRYQFASGSPKHSPMVTPVKPFATIRSSI